jgi:hypothetical protein
MKTDKNWRMNEKMFTDFRLTEERPTSQLKWPGLLLIYFSPSDE